MSSGFGYLPLQNVTIRNVEISIDIAENLIVVAMPEDQDDLMVETEFDFYALIMKQLNQDVFKAINFFFISDSD